MCSWANSSLDIIEKGNASCGNMHFLIHLLIRFKFVCNKNENHANFSAILCIKDGGILSNTAALTKYAADRPNCWRSSPASVTFGDVLYKGELLKAAPRKPLGIRCDGDIILMPSSVSFRWTWNRHLTTIQLTEFPFESNGLLLDDLLQIELFQEVVTGNFIPSIN